MNGKVQVDGYEPGYCHRSLYGKKPTESDWTSTQTIRSPMECQPESQTRDSELDKGLRVPPSPIYQHFLTPRQ